MANNKKNRIIASSVTAALVASAIAPVAGAAFTDSIPTYAKDAVEYVNSKGYMNGLGGTTEFGAAKNITRAEVAVIIAKALNLKTEGKTADFSDVPTTHWATGAIAAVVEAGIAKGTGEGFNPAGQITRQEAAVMFANAYKELQLNDKAEVSFNDENTIASWAKAQVEVLASLGIFGGKTGGVFAPTDLITRGEIAVLVNRAEVPEQRLEVETTEAKVVSVKAVNAKQVKVTFSKAVDKASVLEAAGTLKAGVFAFTTLDSKTITADNATGSLSEDSKTLTITAQTTEIFEGRYDVTINGAKDKAGNALEKYEVKNLTFAKDTVAPTVTTERVSSNKVKLKFSEPVVFSAGALTAKYADSAISPALAASDITVSGTNLSSLEATSAASVSEITLDLNTDVKENKDIVVTLNGVADTAGNLLNPQPATVTISKLTVDGIEPTIATIAQTGAKTFSIKFNKDLDGTTLAATDVTVGGTQASEIKKISASEYEFTMIANLKGLQTVTVAAGKAKDLAGQTNTNDLSKVVTFAEDTVPPKATAKLAIDKNNKEVIELTFDKDVTAGDVTVAGKRVKDYVTTTGISEIVTAVYADGTGNNKKVLHVPLSAVALSVEGAAYDLTVNSTAVKSDADKVMDEVKVQFTRGKDGQLENVNTHIVSNVDVAQSGDNNIVTATFTIPNGTTLDGATATNVANYVIAGAEVESVTLAAANGTTQVVTLKLKEGSNTFTGVRNITVKNVKILGSTKVMEPVTITDVSLNENIAPTIVKAELITSTSIKVTFSENVKNPTNAIVDFDLYIGGEKDARTVTTAVQASATNNVLELTLGTALTAEEVTKGITLKAASTLDIVDAVGNKVSAPNAITITQ